MIAVLTGGVGGAKLVYGLAQIIPNERLSVIVNTADDTYRHSLLICPDLDTTMYTLAGINNTETGWGIQGDRFTTLSMLEAYGRETWFKLGDKDIATHLFRRELLENGKTLTETTAIMARALGVRAQLLPMCNEPVRTIVQTPEGDIPFQDYFVRRQWRDTVLGIRFEEIEKARLSPEVAAALKEAELIIICPSNPVVSIAPILSVPGVRDLLLNSGAIRVAVSPIVGRKAVNGPAARLMEYLGSKASASGVARLYAGLLNGFIMERTDLDEKSKIQRLGMEVLATDTVMTTPADKVSLAKRVLDFAAILKKEALSGC